MHECKSLGHVLTIPTLWEVVEIANSGLVDEFLVSIVQGYHPRLSRLSLRMNISGLSAVYESAALCQLTFLHLQFFPGPVYTPTVIRITLPRLEVLIWEGFVVRPSAPSDIFRLPNLHHFRWSNELELFPLSSWM